MSNEHLQAAEPAPSGKFWLVWSPESEAPPKKRYSDWGGARRAAQMLAAKNPEQTFYVLKSENKGLPVRGEVTP